MFYLGIDQHRKQLTVCLRDEGGNAVLRRQVSTEPQRVRQFFDELENRCIEHGGYVAVLEVCGFNDWLVKLLKEYACRELVLVQPEDRDRKKTDRRDAHRLSELALDQSPAVARGSARTRPAARVHRLGR